MIPPSIDKICEVTDYILKNEPIFLPTSQMNMFHIRTTTAEDSATILSFIRSLGEYEHLAHEVIATEHDIQSSLFGPQPQAEVLLAFVGDIAVGFTLFFQNYSTFLGRSGIHLEDLFVLEAFRGNGYGKALLKKVAQIACLRHAGRLEWNVLDWNTSAIEFYERMGAIPMKGWTTYRLSGPALSGLAISK